jgi:hypothetical protein
MCDCEVCQTWLSDARNHPKNPNCSNVNHCRCCLGQFPRSCIGCNHHNVPLTDVAEIHFHGSIGLEALQRHWMLVQQDFRNLEIKK